MDSMQDVLLLVVASAFIIRVITYNVGQQDDRRIQKYLQQLAIKHVSNTMKRAYNLYEEDFGMRAFSPQGNEQVLDKVTVTAIRVELLHELTRLRSLRVPDDCQGLHQPLVESVDFALRMWETNDFAVRSRLYDQSQDKWGELERFFKTQSSRSSSGFRSTVLGAFLFGHPK